MSDTPDLDLIRGAPWDDEAWQDAAKAIAEAHGTSVVELLKRRVEANHETAALRRDLKRFAALIRERVQKADGVWLGVDDVGRLLGMSRKGIYCELMRHPTGPLAQASSRLGRRLRWSRAGIDELLRTRSPSLKSRIGRVSIKGRVPSPIPRKATT